MVSLSWVGFLAQAGGLIGACLGFSFISAVELVLPFSPATLLYSSNGYSSGSVQLYWFLIRCCTGLLVPHPVLSRFIGSLSGSVQVYWFLIRFCRLSKDRKRREALAARKEEVLTSFINTLHLHYTLLLR